MKLQLNFKNFMKKAAFHATNIPENVEYVLILKLNTQKAYNAKILLK